MPASLPAVSADSRQDTAAWQRGRVYRPSFHEYVLRPRLHLSELVLFLYLFLEIPGAYFPVPAAQLSAGLGPHRTA